MKVVAESIDAAIPPWRAGERRGEARTDAGSSGVASVQKGELMSDFSWREFISEEAEGSIGC